MAFQDDEAAIYKGRSPEIIKGMELLASLRRRGRSAPHFVLVLGASGSGKSSLVRAGLIPRLRVSSEWLPLPAFQPRSNPIFELAEALSQAFAVLKSPRAYSKLEETLTQATTKTPPDGGALLTLSRELRISGQCRADATVLLVIDQAEELFQ